MKKESFQKMMALIKQFPIKNSVRFIKVYTDWSKSNHQVELPGGWKEKK